MERGTLAPNEAHPAAIKAMDWIRAMPVDELMTWQDSFASSALAGNRLGDVCGETLHRLLSGQPVSDRYLLGLAWAMHQ